MKFKVETTFQLYTHLNTHLPRQERCSKKKTRSPQELTFSYIDDSSMSTAERKRFIRTSWDFECRCLRCTADGADAAPKGARMTTRTLWAVGTVRTVVDAAVEVNACQVSHIAAVLNSCAQASKTGGAGSSDHMFDWKTYLPGFNGWAMDGSQIHESP